jgi:predicted ferric reductase
MQAVHNRDLKNANTEQPDDGLMTTTLLLMGVLVGAVVAVVVLPVWVPSTGASATDTDQTIFWHLSRASGFVSFGLIWMSMAFGLIITNKMARVWPGGPTAFDLHEYTSILGLGFGLLHALVLIFHGYIDYDLISVFVPFASADYRPIWVALGQIGLYGLAVVTFSFYVRKKLGQSAWRMVHYGSYGLFALVMLHGIFSGTDTGIAWSGLIYWFAGASMVVLTVYRVLVMRSAKQARAGA